MSVAFFENKYIFNPEPITDTQNGKFIDGKFNKFRDVFKSNIAPFNNEIYQVAGSVKKGVAVSVLNPEIRIPGASEIIKNAYTGHEVKGGKISLGLHKIGEYNINPETRYQNIKQHAGWAAEVLGTARDNIQAAKEGSGLKTFRTDELPNEYKKNDEFVDKVVKNDQGKVVERIQVKFVGKDASECLSKLASPKYDKYFGDKVDKIEIPSDYYHEIKNKLINERISGLKKGLDKAVEDKDFRRVHEYEAKIKKYRDIDKRIKQSKVSSGEAIFTKKHPAMAKVLNNPIAKSAISSGLTSASITAVISSMDNFKKYVDGKITVKDAVFDVTKKTATAFGASAGLSVVSSYAIQKMASSNVALISKLGKSGIPSLAISVAVDSYGSVIDYWHGDITGKQLAINLGRSTARAGGAMAGMAITAPLAAVPGGFIIQGGAGMLGAEGAERLYNYAIENPDKALTQVIAGPIVGYMLATAATKSAFDAGDLAGAKEFGDKAASYASETMRLAEKYLPNRVDSIRNAFNEHLKTNFGDEIKAV